MVVSATPLFEINQTAIEVLIKELGIVNTIIFFNQFVKGKGDYTIERREIFKDFKLEDIQDYLKAKRIK